HVGGSTLDAEATGDAGWQEDAFGVVFVIGRTSGDRIRSAENVAFESVSADGDGEIEIVVEGIARGVSGSISPGNGDPERFGRIRNRAGESAGLASAGEFVAGEFVTHNALRAVESHAKIDLAHALIVGPKRIVGP